ncbi:MAG: hypothetical protein ACXAAH_07255 [Promethearchaeota archaeon]|jgi:vacuolar-type H+-ATPase subunit H
MSMIPSFYNEAILDVIEKKIQIRLLLVLFMLEVLNIIKEKQREAKKIIKDAHIEAEKIKKDLLEKSVTANEEAFLFEITQAEKRAQEMLKSNNLGIGQKIKQIMSTAEQQAKNIEFKAKTNHEKAVNDVLDMIILQG